VSSAEARTSVPAEWEFVRRIASGDADAEDEFVRRFDRGVRALVRRRCRSGEASIEDLVQDVLVRVLEKLRAGALREAEALPAYVQATIAHVTAAFYRNPMNYVAAARDDANSAPASDPDPVETAAAEQMQRRLRSLLDELPMARDRQLLALFYLEEQDKEAVCRVLGIDEGHFHRVVFRARERFREIVDRSGISGAVT
jgi:RNA polymerase sigma-70 factor (ECF subfamily)